MTDGVETMRGIADWELQVRATAADLYLLLWNRRPWSEPDATTGAHYDGRPVPGECHSRVAVMKPPVEGIVRGRL